MPYPPYPGQGMSVPKETGFDGQWVIEDEIFLFRAIPPGAMGEFAGIQRPDGVECDGFDADLLAKLLGITADELMEANRRKLLMVEFKKVPAGPGADITIEYEICTPTTGVRQRVSRASIKGRA